MKAIKKTKSKQDVWLKVLSEYCGCKPSYNGNMPCDNGLVCDRCMTEEVQKIYRKQLKKYGLA